MFGWDATARRGTVGSAWLDRGLGLWRGLLPVRGTGALLEPWLVVRLGDGDSFGSGSPCLSLTTDRIKSLSDSACPTPSSVSSALAIEAALALPPVTLCAPGTDATRLGGGGGEEEEAARWGDAARRLFLCLLEEELLGFWLLWLALWVLVGRELLLLPLVADCWCLLVADSCISSSESKDFMITAASKVAPPEML